MANPPGPESFESLPLPHRDMPGVGLSRYRVYTDYANYTIVEALSVIDALHASGKKQAYRVLRDSLSLHNVLDISVLIGDLVALPAPAAPAQIAAAVSAPAAQEDADAASEEVFINPPSEPDVKS